MAKQDQNPSPSSSLSPASAGEGEAVSIDELAVQVEDAVLDALRATGRFGTPEALYSMAVTHLSQKLAESEADAERLRERNGALEKALASIACSDDSGSWGARGMKNTATKALGLRCESEVRRAYFPALSERPAEGEGDSSVSAPSGAEGPAPLSAETIRLSERSAVLGLAQHYRSEGRDRTASILVACEKRIANLEAENAAQSKQLKDLFDLLLTVESLKRAAKRDGEVDERAQGEEIAEVFAAAKHARVTHFNVYAEQPKQSHGNAWEDEDA